MARDGRKPKPHLQAVREGNPGKRPLAEGVKLPPSTPIEPSWLEIFPGDSDAEERVRETSRLLWRRLAPSLVRAMGLTAEQQETLTDFCVTWARIEQGERALSLEGVVVATERGMVKNPWVTVLNQYRSHYRSLIGELGLSPSAATRITAPEGSDDDDPFD